MSIESAIGVAIIFCIVVVVGYFLSELIVAWPSIRRRYALWVAREENHTFRLTIDWILVLIEFIFLLLFVVLSAAILQLFYGADHASGGDGQLSSGQNMGRIYAKGLPLLLLLNLGFAIVGFRFIKRIADLGHRWFLKSERRVEWGRRIANTLGIVLERLVLFLFYGGIFVIIVVLIYFKLKYDLPCRGRYWDNC